MNSFPFLMVLAFLASPFRANAQTAGPTAPNVEPKKSGAFSVEQVRIESSFAGVTRKGSLMLPSGAAIRPAVVLISGLDDGDRVLSEHLANAGIAVLRVEEGTEKSAGNSGDWNPPAFTEDTLAGVRWLKARTGIDPKHIGLVGHSRGGYAAAMAAAKQPEDVAFVVLLAAIGVPAAEWRTRQTIDFGRAGGADEASLAKLVSFQRELFPLLARAVDTEEARRLTRDTIAKHFAGFTPDERKKLGLDEATLKSLEDEASAPWFREFIGFDPRPHLRGVKCPVLAIHGSKDLVVAASDNLASIAAALKSGGNERVKTIEFPGLDHEFQPSRIDASGIKGPSVGPFSAAALKAVSDWIGEQTKR